MEPGPRRRACRPLVSVFLRDPGSGRVYRRGKLIGKGAFSRCYKLTDMSTSTVFALKVVPRGSGGGGAGHLCPRGKVEREIALHSRLRHRNIVAFHGHFADRDHVYMVLEYCSRKSLAHVLAARRTLTEPEVRYYLRGLVSGLRYLHQRRIVHRDLKLTPLSEMYQNIRASRYPEPAHLSPAARCLIARLLAPDPAERPSLEQLLQDDFFTQGFTPDRLPPHSCHSPPIFAIPRPLGRLFRKVGRLLLTQGRPPCPVTPTEASGPGEDSPHPDSMDWGGEASPSERGSPRLEVPVHLLSQGTLRSDVAGPEGSPRQEVDAAIRKLTLCLDPGPPGPTGTPAPFTSSLCPATQAPRGEQRPPLWALKWVDHSSKYGFGYQLSDGGSGVLFWDGTHMALRPPGGRVCYVPARGKLETYAPRDVPGPLGAKLAVLRLLACSGRRQRRREEGRLPPPAGPGPCLLRFLASERALLLLFSDGTVQVSCRGDQTQLVLSGADEELLLTVWDRGQPGASYPLGVLRTQGCAPDARQRLHHALRMLQSI
ncbi:inactive serine/threonine-protein kinase PLK5 isoform X3 [Equus quagga]|uniref:inactive serine/threonine-protein kinase PLK5 isoform X3 n=1 Tax=Equus quagga TaxID=89248 RepID=UPI001EE18307|nr:inactive serine/threonine-protein kinase PLK5 isoform X3 [Equus quagga]